MQFFKEVFDMKIIGYEELLELLNDLPDGVIINIDLIKED